MMVVPLLCGALLTTLFPNTPEIEHAFKGEVAICRGDAQGRRRDIAETAGVAARGALQAFHRAAAGGSSTKTRSQRPTGGSLVAGGRNPTADRGEGLHLLPPGASAHQGQHSSGHAGAPCGEAEKCFMESLELSRTQGSRAWELRHGNRSRGALGRTGRAEGRARAVAAGLRAVR